MGTTILELKLDKETGTYGPAVAQVLESSDGELQAVNMGGMVRQVVGFELFNVPLGKAVVGGAIAGLADGILHFVEPMIPRTGLVTGSQRRALLMFLGVGALTDFTPLIKNPMTVLLGAAAQFGIFAALIAALFLGWDIKTAGAIGIIGSADGPTTIFVSTQLAELKLW